VGRHRATMLDDSKWRVLAEEGGSVVQLMRVHRQVTIRSKLVNVETQHDWDPNEPVFVYGKQLPGFVESDGSVGVSGTTRLEWEDGRPVELEQRALESMVGATVNASEFSRLRVVHEICQYKTVLVLASAVQDGSAPELQHGSTQS